jgi:hypothetical protein
VLAKRWHNFSKADIDPLPRDVSQHSKQLQSLRILLLHFDQPQASFHMAFLNKKNKHDSTLSPTYTHLLHTHTHRHRHRHKKMGDLKAKQGELIATQTHTPLARLLSLDDVQAEARKRLPK